MTRRQRTSASVLWLLGAIACGDDAGSGVDTGDAASELDASAGKLDASGRASDGALPATRDPAANASWLIQSGDAVFFVGNSFFGGEDDRLAELVAQVADSLAPPFAIQTGQHVVYGNQPLGWFLQQPESQDAIASGRYKLFVLQGEEREPVESKAAFRQAVRDYHRAVTARGGKIMLFMTWGLYSDRASSFFEQLVASYEELGQELDVPVIPVGLIYDDCDKDPYDGEQSYWLTSRELHQNEKGTAVNVYATFAMLTGINPLGQPFFPRNGKTNPPALLQYLSDKTWARVAPRLHK